MSFSMMEEPTKQKTAKNKRGKTANESGETKRKSLGLWSLHYKIFRQSRWSNSTKSACKSKRIFVTISPTGLAEGFAMLAVLPSLVSPFYSFCWPSLLCSFVSPDSSQNKEIYNGIFRPIPSNIEGSSLCFLWENVSSKDAVTRS